MPLPTPLAMTLLFVTALVAGTVLQLWLVSRQIRHVAAHREQVPAAFSGTISPDAHRKAADYTIDKARFSLAEGALGVAMLLGWTLLGGLDWLNARLIDQLGPGMVQQLALVAGFVLIGSIADLPLAWYATFRLEQRHGFNRTTPSLWLVDLAKSALLGALIGLPLLWLVLWLMAAAGDRWWLWAWGVWVAFNLLLLLIYPTLIAPWFNRFEPLDDTELRDRVTALMRRCGFSAKGLFVMDGSRRSAHANAYFTGFGASKRVVFYDTLLKRLAPGEVDAVLAHELGHFHHRHVLQRIVMLFAASLAGLALLGWLATQPWFYAGLGVTPSLLPGHRQDAMALVLFLLVVPVFSQFLSPLMAHLSRRHEFQADRFAVGHTSGADLRNALLKLYEDNASTLTPDPVYVRFHYSHPAAAERLARMAG